MAFTDKMRESLGAEGARLEITGPSDPVTPGSTTTATVVITGGTKPAHIDALTVKVVESRRHWTTDAGEVVAEQDATEAQRSQLTPGWERLALSERRVELGTHVDPGGREEVEVQVEVPTECAADTLAINHNIFVQADIKGQIDPTTITRLPVG